MVELVDIKTLILIAQSTEECFQTTLYTRLVVNFTKWMKNPPFCGARFPSIFLKTTTLSTHSKMQWVVLSCFIPNVDGEKGTTVLSFSLIWFQPKNNVYLLVGL